MRQSVTRDLYAYWSRVKGARSVPERSEIDPAQICEALADTFMIEIDPLGSYPIRLSGARVNAFWLAEQKGRSFLELWEERDRGSLAEVLASVVESEAPVAARAHGGVGPSANDLEGGDRLELELVLLPLRHFGRTPSRVLGAFSPIRLPYWLGYVSVGPLALRSVHLLHSGLAKEISPRPLVVARAPEFATSQRKM